MCEHSRGLWWARGKGTDPRQRCHYRPTKRGCRAIPANTWMVVMLWCHRRRGGVHTPDALFLLLSWDSGRKDPLINTQVLRSVFTQNSLTRIYGPPGPPSWYLAVSESNFLSIFLVIDTNWTLGNHTFKFANVCNVRWCLIPKSLY